MKHMKRMMALMLAFVLCLSMSGMAAFADETPAAQPESGEFNKGTFSQTAETTISATGLTAGDTVEVYQLVKWDATTSDWALNGTCGVTLDELVNGITSFCAAAARLNIPLTEWNEPLHVIPASHNTKEPLDLPGTYVLMKSASHMKETKDILIASGRKTCCVENCGMENEKVYRTAEEIPDDAGYFSLVIAKENGGLSAEASRQGRKSD